MERKSNTGPSRTKSSNKTTAMVANFDAMTLDNGMGFHGSLCVGFVQKRIGSTVGELYVAGRGRK